MGANAMSAPLSFDLTAGAGRRVQAEVHGITGVVGRSGVGKTTLLHALAGLVPAVGTVTLDGDDLSSRAPHTRGFRLVFQDLRLFPHRTVADNLAFGGPDDAALRDVAADLGLTELLPRAVQTLSGGEARRVAIGRAVLAQPRALLLDEPLVGLDAASRRAVRTWLATTLRTRGIPALWVSHTVDDIVAVADDLLILADDGDATQGPVADLWATDPTLAHGAGVPNVLRGTRPPTALEGGAAPFAWGGTTLWAPPPPDDGADTLLLDPHGIVLAADALPRTSARNTLAGRLIATHPQGDRVTATVAVGDATLIVELTQGSVAALGLVPDRPVTLLFKTSALRWA